MKKCPYCAEEIQSEAIKCRYCHSDLSPAKVTQEIESRQNPLEQTTRAQNELEERIKEAESWAKSRPKDVSKISDIGGMDIRPTVPDIEEPLTIMEKTTVSAYCAEGIPKKYAWLVGTVDLVLAPNAIVVIAAAPVTSFYKTAHKVADIGLVGGNMGGLLISIPAGLLGAAHENFLGKKNKFDKASLQTLADSGNAIWIETSAASFYSIYVKGGIFDAGCLYAIKGSFETTTGKLSMSLSKGDELYASASVIRKSFEKPGYSFRRSVVKKNADLRVP